MKKKFVTKKFTKNQEYKKVLAVIEKEGKCPFCTENFKYHKHPVLKKDGDWIITQISWPYKNTSYHFILISRRHKEQFGQLRNADMIAMSKLVKWAIRKFNIRGGAITLRFGDPALTGATVRHLHAHLIVPLKSKTVLFPVG